MLTAMIQVTTPEGPEPVRATLSDSGLLGVHRTLAGMRGTVDRWQITHVLTGYGVLRMPLRLNALRIMRYIDGWDWGFASAQAVPELTRRRSLDLLSILRNDALLEGLPC